ncbi:hypothetical protein AAFF_G00380340 [Aldrovandia affinis]|uniref:Uncharacterized protein n=1 Tax=Aldrovandia affinis TaxID=143900 RepID=A0AAD7T804_9TELE|nr:hypothetical protein AAFF_G00380340 [Aldrovandia affinis]
MSPSLEGAALLTTPDLAPPVEWGDFLSPAGDGMAYWDVESLVETMGMVSGLTRSGGLGCAVVFSSLRTMQGDVYLLQKVNLRDEEDAAAFEWEWVWSPSGWGSRLEVCLSTTRFLILGGEFSVCFDRRDGVGKGGIDYSARALALVVKDFSLVDTFRALHPSDAGFMWRNTRGAVSRLDYIFVGGGQSDMSCVLLPSTFVHFAGGMVGGGEEPFRHLLPAIPGCGAPAV